LRNSSTFPENCGKDFWQSKRAIALLVLLCFAVPARAIDPHRMISQYARDHWGEKEGFSGGSVSSIAQSADGYLWIGSEKGLIRFDGLRFQAIQQATPESFSIGPVRALVSDAHSNLWILLQSTNVLRLRDGNFELGRGEAEFGITAIGKKRDGTVLLSSVALGTLTFNGQKFEVVPSGAQDQPTAAAMAAAQGDTDLFARLSWATGLASHRVAEPNSAVISVAETSDGRIWLGTADRGLFYLRDGHISAMKKLARNAKITSLLPLANGALWVGTDKGVFECNGVEISQAKVPSSLHRAHVLAMIRDRDSNLWIGTSSGLFRVNGDGVSSDQADHGSAGPVTALFEDREGDIWIGSADGIERLRDSPFVTYTSADVNVGTDGALYTSPNGAVWFAPSKGGLGWWRNGKIGRLTNDQLNRDVVYSITGRENDLWVGRQRGGLTHVRYVDGSITTQTYTQAQGLAQNSVYAVYEASDGAVWAGTLSAGVSEFRNGHFTNYTVANGLASNTVSWIEEGNDGTIWFGTPKGLSGLSKTGWRTYATGDGTPSDIIDCLFRDSAGLLWIGTTNGLAFLNAGQVHVPRSEPESLREPIFGIAEDKIGSLWISTANHVLQVKRADLVADNLTGMSLREYGVADGLLGTEGVKRERSVIEQPNSGQILISTNRGVSVVNPTRATVNPVPAIVRIQSVLADGSPLELRNPLQILPGQRKITFEFIGLSLADSERVRYRYKLDGFDKDWSEPVATREASYANLGAGPYRFHVNASNSDGLWNGSEAAIDFRVEPTLWQTWWFRLGILLCVGLATLGIHRLRMRQLTHLLNLRFEERLAERTRIAQDLHDNLLQGFFSAAMQLDVANDRIPAGSPAKPILERVIELMNQVGQQGRSAIRSLRASDSSSRNLEQAFSTITDELGIGKQVDFRVVVEGEPQTIQPVVWDEVYRIGREAVINAFRHSRAANIEVEVEYATSGLRVLVRDDGCGIDAQVLQSGREGHWGLPGMRERAEQLGASFEVLSRAGAGTEVELSVPGAVAFESFSQSRFPAWLTGLFQRKNGNKSAAD